MVPASRYFEDRDDVLVLRRAPRDLVARGAWLAFAAPWVVAAVGWSIFAVLASEPTRLGFLVSAAIIGACAFSFVLVGVASMLTARRRALASRVLIDLDEHLITRPGGAAEVFRRPDRVLVSGRGIGWELALGTGSENVTLLRVPRASGRALVRAAERLAERLEIEASIPPRARRASGFVPEDPDVWAALAYSPLDGVNLAYSLFALVVADHPRVRFAAKQSVALFGVEASLLLAVFTCLGLPFALLPLPIALEVLVLAFPLFVFGLLHVGLRLFAAYRAHRGRVWVIPGLSLLSRRWVPEEDHASKASIESTPSSADRVTPST